MYSSVTINLTTGDEFRLFSEFCAKAALLADKRAAEDLAFAQRQLDPGNPEPAPGVAASEKKEPARPRGKRAQPEPAQPEPAQPEPAQPEPAQPEPAQPEPATVTGFDLSHDGCRSALKAACDKYGLPAATKILGSFGVKSVSALPDKDFAAFISTCENWEG